MRGERVERIAPGDYSLMEHMSNRQAEACAPAEASEEPPKSRSTIQIPGLLMVLLIVGIWVLAALLINPRGEFPLNDDWCYAGTVKALLETGTLKLPGCSSPNIIAQILWGALFCLPFGFSFVALRISTLTLGVIGVLALYGLLREIEADRETALFGALLLAFNPLYLGLSYTFMSDVPFTAVSIVSFYFLVRGIRRNLPRQVAAGLFFACVALLIRQNGLAIFMAFGLAYLVKSRLRLRNVLLASIPLALGGAVQLLWQLWLTHKHIFLPVYARQARSILSPDFSWQAAVPFVRGLVIISAYLGLFLFPLLLFVGRTKLAQLWRSRLLNLAALLFALFAAYLLRQNRMPILPNVLYDLGIGPATLRDSFLLKLPSLPTAGKTFWSAVTFVGLVGASVLLQMTFLALGKALNIPPITATKRVPLVLLFAGGLIYLVPMAMLFINIDLAFDRYLLFLVPLGIAIVILLVNNVSFGNAGSALRTVAIASLVLYATFSIAGTHDYLSWNRARWQALNNLAAERVTPIDIDGGFEFNGWYLYDLNYIPRLKKSWWWVFRDDFMVTFGPVPEFTEIKRYPFRRWLPPGEGNILVLQRTTPN
jgi:4-amino-4-deoxy-L-arabinose transferase-like glycosyltransferase